MDKNETYLLGRIFFLGREIYWSLLKYAMRESAHCENV